MKIVAMLPMVMICVGCAHGIDVDDSSDGGHEAVVFEASAGPVCCQVNKSIDTDAELWQNYTYSCSPMEPPWICGSDLACSSPSCVSGDNCRGFNGSGLVVPCPNDE